MSNRFNPPLSANEEAVAAKARQPKRLPILCLDFDGVLHGYQNGWQGAAIIPDPPVPGAVEFLHSAVERFQVAIYSSRSGQPGGIDAMRGWLTMWLLAAIEDRREAGHVLSLIQWPTEKPAAIVTIDDRAIQFTGKWPSLDEIAGFKPWNKRPAPDSTRTGQVEAGEKLVRLLAAVSDRLRDNPPNGLVEGDLYVAAKSEGTDSGWRYVPTGLTVGDLDEARALLAARPAAPEAQGAWRSQAVDDVLAERRRQVEAEGWTPAHDDGHSLGELGLAAALYALPYDARVGGEPLVEQDHHIGLDMALEIACGWHLKPDTDPRRRLVKAGALILAEIERRDRLPAPPASSGQESA